MELRLEGGNPGGNHMLPRTVKYVRVRNEDGKVISAHWELIPLGVERMLLAYRLLFEGDSYHTIAEKLGHGWTGKGIQEAMRNPIHIGIRRYLYEYTGTEYLPEPSVVNPKPKKRRRPVKREVPLDVPTRAELEAGTAKPIVEPIISLEVWDRAQEIMDARMASWRKSKLKNDGRDRHLAASVGKCNCGQPLYGRYGSMKRAHLDRYACKTQWPSGPGCGMKSILRIDLDAAIMETVTRLADAKFLLSVFEAAVAFEQATPDPARAAREQALAKLETGRKEMLGMVRDGEMTRAEFKAEMATLEANVRALEAMAPAPAPTINAKQIVQAVARVFVQFDLLTNSQQRTLLRSAVKSIIVDSHARAITTVTVSGGYLGSGSNLARGLTSTPQIRSIPDVTIHFPEPVVIADTFNGGRFCSESRLNGPARARRPQ
jgi:hypothetical protein